VILGQLQHLLLHLILFWEKLYRNPIEGFLKATTRHRVQIRIELFSRNLHAVRKLLHAFYNFRSNR